MPEPVSLLQAKLDRSAARIEKAAKLNSLLDAAYIAGQIGDAAREQDCLQQAQKLYEELNANNPAASSH